MMVMISLNKLAIIAVLVLLHSQAIRARGMQPATGELPRVGEVDPTADDGRRLKAISNSIR